MPELPPSKRAPQTQAVFLPAPRGKYAELHCRTNFSFLEGASHADELVQRAAELGYSALAITDLHSLAGVARAHVAAKEVGLKLLIGAEVRPVDSLPMVLWATDRAAYGRLSRLLTLGRRRAPKGECHLTFADVAEHAEGVICGVLGSQRSEEGQEISNFKFQISDSEMDSAPPPLRKAESSILKFEIANLKSQVSNSDPHAVVCGSPAPAPTPKNLKFEIPNAAEVESANPARQSSDSSPSPSLGIWDLGSGISPSAISPIANVFPSRCYLLAELHRGPDDQRRLRALAAIAREAGIPLAAANDVHYHAVERQPLQDVLTAVRHGCTVAEAAEAGWLFSNAERSLQPIETLTRRFEEFPEALARTLEIADRCTFSLDELRYEYPEELAPPGQTPLEFLTTLTWQGAAERYPKGLPEKVRRLIEHELELIAELRYEAYFLTVWDLVRFARSRQILCQGRGSAANSAVCYCLSVTSVDPERIDVLFERFVSRERNEAPDIDVDFEHERREEVLQYIYEKYGRERAGMTAEVITYRARSAVRDVGKALGLSLDGVDRLAKSIDSYGHLDGFDRCCLEAGLEPRSPLAVRLQSLVADLIDFPRHLSQHVGGMVITQGPLCELVPIENAAMPGRTVIEWDKDDLDALGLLKVDCLCLGMLTAIRKCFELIRVQGTGIRRQGISDFRFQISERQVVRGSPDLAPRSTEGLPNVWAPSPSQNLKSEISNLKFEISDSLRADERSGDLRSAAVRGQETRAQHVGAENLKSEISNLKFPGPSPLVPRPFPDPNTLLASIPPEDPAVYDMICKADTMGVFQIESRAQMSMLPRLRPRCFYDLVIEVAIVRPGPIQGNMVHPYLRRRAGQEKVEYPNQTIRDVLHKTLGVPIFQEQAMRLAVVAAGFTPGEADQLRRAMGAWRKTGIIDKFRQKLISGMQANGYTTEFAESVFNQIRGFGEYGFPESHSASFALLVYVSAWLKHHHMAAFTAALLNSQPMGFYAPAQLVRNFRDHGGEVRPVDVNFSDWNCTLEEGAGDQGSGVGSKQPALRLGLRMVKGLAREDGEKIVQTRKSPDLRSQGSVVRGSPAPAPGPTAGLPSVSSLAALEDLKSEISNLKFQISDSICDVAPQDSSLPARGSSVSPLSPPTPLGIWDLGSGISFLSLDDFAHRTGLSQVVLTRLARADAFGSLRLDRRTALWETLKERSQIQNPKSQGGRSQIPDPRSQEGRSSGMCGFPDPAPGPTPSFGASAASQDLKSEISNLKFQISESPSDVPHLDSSLPARGSSVRPSSPAPETSPPTPLGILDLGFGISHPSRQLHLFTEDAPEPRPALPALSEHDQVLADYRTVSLSLRAHPVSFIREELDCRRVTRAGDLPRIRNGRYLRVAGVVLVRQRPGTAKGITFITLEDETGQANLVVRPEIMDRYRKASRTAATLLAHGSLEIHGDVIHLLVNRLEDVSELLRQLPSQSRDFR